MSRDDYNKDFQLPDSILTQMEEMSGGGFIIFILDSNNKPSVYESFDGYGQESQVKSFALDWLDAEREIRKEILKNDIRSIIGPIDDDDDDDDEEKV